MNKCPKCGGTEIGGPKYGKSMITGLDYLQYWCARCRYSVKKPCDDREEKQFIKDRTYRL